MWKQNTASGLSRELVQSEASSLQNAAFHFLYRVGRGPFSSISRSQIMPLRE